MVMCPTGIGPENDCADEASSNCKRQTCPLVREGIPYQQTRKCLTNKNLVLGPRRGLDTRRTGRLTVDRNITLILTWVMTESVVKSDKLVAEAGASLGTQIKGNVGRCKLLPSNDQ
jgi:hypothetical protein